MLKSIYGLFSALLFMAAIYFTPVSFGVFIELSLLSLMGLVTLSLPYFRARPFWKSVLLTGVVTSVLVLIIACWGFGGDIDTERFQMFRATYSTIWIGSLGVHWRMWSGLLKNTE